VTVVSESESVSARPQSTTLLARGEVTSVDERGGLPLRVQRRNVLLVALDGAAIGLMSAAGAFISVLVIRLGASPVWVSLLSSLPSAISLLMAIPWSGFAERQARSQAVFAWARLGVHVVYPLVALVPFFLDGALAAQAIVIVWSLSSFLSSLSNMMFTVVMGRAVAPERRAFLMSRRWTFLGIAKLIALPIASQLIDRVTFPRGYQIVYGLNFVIALGAFYLAIQLRVRERPPVAPAKGQPLQARVRKGVAELLQAKPFLVFVSGRAMLNLGLALVSALIPIYWVKHLDVSDTWVGYLTATLSAATLVSYFPWVRIRRKFGTRWTLIPSVVAAALYPALLALTRSPVAVLPAIALNGLAAGGLNLSFFDGLLGTCPQGKEERFVAINMTAINLMGVIGPPIGAALLGVLHIRWVLVIGTAIALLGAAIFAGTTKGGRGTSG
jgi:MFS family permease